MGAVYDSHRFKPEVKTRAQVETAYKEMIDDLIFQYGRDRYNGRLSSKPGVCYELDRIFDSTSAADAYLDENSHKGEPAIVVKVIEKRLPWSAVTADPMFAKAENELHRASVQAREDRAALIGGLIEAKPVRPCNVCGSRISLRWEVEGAQKSNVVISCPQCKAPDSLLMVGEKKKLDRIIEKLESIRARSEKIKQDVRARLLEKAPIDEFFYVGGNCLS